MKTGLIYLREFRDTGKGYVGKTFDLKRRNTDFISQCFNVTNKSYNSHLSRSVRKYGLEALNLKILEDNIPEHLLGQKEIEWIAIYGTYDPEGKKGYNRTKGGDGGGIGPRKKRHKAWTNQEEIVKDHTSGLSARKIAKKNSCATNVIINILKENNVNITPNVISNRGPLYQHQETIICLYQKGFSANQIAKKFSHLGKTEGSVRNTILKILHLNNIEVRSLASRSLYNGQEV